MTEEIKENIKSYYIGNDIDKLLNYITNLQKENMNLQQKVKGLENQITKYQDEIFARDNSWYDMQD